MSFAAANAIDLSSAQELYGYMMLTRCLNNKRDDWKYYGGRGITVCKRWRDNFDNFVEDMGYAPDGLKLERRNNDENYEPSNCIWASHQDQCRNRRSTKFLEKDGKVQCISAWAEDLGISPRTIMSRLRLGWSAEKALTSRKFKRTYERIGTKGRIRKRG